MKWLSNTKEFGWTKSVRTWEADVKDECNTKYGTVVKVLIYEMPDAPQEEAIRIFDELKRIESAITAVVDLNGGPEMFFEGRQLKVGLYVWEKLNNLEVMEQRYIKWAPINLL